MEHATQHALNWFEIPASNLDRAATFYETLLASPLRRETIGARQLGVFSHDETGVGGCLIAGSEVPAPATHGMLIYLNARPSLDAVLARVEAAGGRITTPKVRLPGDMGCFVHSTDTEGKRIGLHALA